MIDSLRSLSDQDVLNRTLELVSHERGVTLRILEHLIEIDRRKLHLKSGFRSMFDYCTAGLNYSSSAAWRRIQTARCMALFPAIRGMLERNEVNLSTIAQVSRVLNNVNQDLLLSRICGRAQREVATIVAEYEPRTVFRDRIREVVVEIPVAPAPAVQPSLIESPAPTSTALPIACEKSDYCRSGSELSAPPTPRLETRVRLALTVHPEFMAQLGRVRALASHLPGNASFEDTVAIALNFYIQCKDPVERARRRALRTRTGTKDRADARKNARAIPAHVRDEVFLRDKQCTYVSPDGRKCGSTHVLQVDHIEPVARGGPGTIDNLRVLCAYHNRLEAERLMGASGKRRQPSPETS